jgi:hypothetical protein
MTRKHRHSKPPKGAHKEKRSIKISEQAHKELRLYCAETGENMGDVASRLIIEDLGCCKRRAQK